MLSGGRSAWASRCRPSIDSRLPLTRERRAGDLLETLLHELVHLHVGRAEEAHAWHGPTFKRTLAQAMREAFGIVGLHPRSTRHGAYADAIEATRVAPPAERL